MASNYSPSFVNVTSTGILYTNQVVESYQTYSTNITNTNAINIDCSLGQVINVNPTTISSNMTFNLTNLSLTTGKVSNVTFIINQTANPGFIISALQIGGVGQTINWQGGSAPTASVTPKKDAFAFSIMYNGSTYTVFGQMVSFG